MQRVVNNSRMTQNSDYFIVCSFIINSNFQCDLMIQTQVKRIEWRGIQHAIEMRCSATRDDNIMLENKSRLIKICYDT